MGNIVDQDLIDWLMWFEKYCNYKGLSETEKRDLFIMMLQGPAADWVNGLLVDSFGSPSFNYLRNSS